MTDGPIDRDPTRLLHDPAVDEGLRQTLRQAASHVPPIDTAAGLARLESTITSGGASGGGGGASGSALSPTVLAAGAVAVALLGGGIWYGSQASQATAPVADAPAVAVPVEVPVEEVVAPPVVGGPVVEGPVVEEPVVAVVPEAAQREADEADEREADEREADEREAVPTRVREPRLDQPAVAEDEPAPVDASALAREMARIAEARRALDADPARALALVDESRREMPRSVLAQERDAIRVLALAGLGRTQEAAPLARRFLEAHPTSPFAERIRRAVALP